MPTYFVKGDLFRYPGLDAFAHGCNCSGAMGKGIAVEFRRRFPSMYMEYKQQCARGQFNLGDVFMWTNGSIVVFNLGTQQSWRTKASIDAVEAATRKMVVLAVEQGIQSIGLPRIGSGLGGLNWEEVRLLLAKAGEDTGVRLIVFEEFAPSV